MICVASIEGIATIPDHSPGPKVSLLVQTAGRQLRITAEDAGRHQVWFEVNFKECRRISPSSPINMCLLFLVSFILVGTIITLRRNPSCSFAFNQFIIITQKSKLPSTETFQIRQLVCW